MIRIFDTSTDREIGTLTDAQLQFLLDQLEEESREDQDYYISRETLEMFEGAGANPALLELLRNALGDREDMDIRWSRT